MLHGTGWNQDYFTDTGRLLTRQDLDEVSTEIAIILERACGHILTANTRAIALAGVTNGSTPPAGGAFDFDENGQLTGIFRENACGLLLRLKPANTPETIAATLRLAMKGFLFSTEWGPPCKAAKQANELYQYTLFFGPRPTLLFIITENGVFRHKK